MSIGDPQDTTWNYTTTTTNTTNEVWYYYNQQTYGQPYFWTPAFNTPQYEERNIPLLEGVEMKGLFEVILCYGENRKAIDVKKYDAVIADNEEDAKVKSGVYGDIPKDWDADYLTIIVRKLGDVKVKERPKEVKQV